MDSLLRIDRSQTIVSSFVKLLQYFLKLVGSINRMKAFTMAFLPVVKTSAIFRRFLRVIDSLSLLSRLFLSHKLQITHLPLISRLLFNLSDHFLLLNHSENKPKLSLMFVSLLRNWLWVLDCFVLVAVGCYQTATLRERIQTLVFST
jgi:hypothetical protein